MKPTLSCLIMCLILNTAKADTFNPAVYIGASAGYGQTALARPAGVSDYTTDGLNWSILAGLRLSKMVAIESGYLRMNDVHAAGVFSGIDVADTVQPSLTYIAAKVNAPVLLYTDIYAKLGYAYNHGKENLMVNGVKTIRTRGDNTVYLASGIAYTLSNSLSLDIGVVNTFKTRRVPRLITFAFGLNYIITNPKPPEPI